MSTNLDSFTFPNSSSDLCFDGKAFIEPSFSADRFLQEHRGRASLETMRDDLGSYLKVLRSATLDLIDQEYADFVGLSSSLVGLDKAVGKIRDPLGQLREEVMTVESSLDEAVNGLKSQLQSRRTMRLERAKLEFLSQALTSLRHLEILLDDVHSQENLKITDSTLQMAERAAAEFNHLQFCLGRCNIAEKVKLRTELINKKMIKLLEKMLLEALRCREDEKVIEIESQGEHHPSSHLTRILHTYASLGLCSIAEELTGELLIAPALDDIMRTSKDVGRGSAVNLSSIYAKVLKLVEQKLGKLLELTADGQRPAPVKGFDFLAHSFWPQFVKKLEVHFPNIDAPGNPDVFHQRYSETMTFLQQLEKSFIATSRAIQHFRSQPSYQPFLNSWNLPVYFQIRFQEIAGSLECLLPSPQGVNNSLNAKNMYELMGLKKNEPSYNGFWIVQTSTSWDCLIRCWDKNVFISQLAYRFWKMNLQIVARYCEWCKEVLEHLMKAVQDENVDYQSGKENTKEGVESGEGTTSHTPSQSQVLLSPPLLILLCLHRDAVQLSVRLEKNLLPLVIDLLNPLVDKSDNRDVESLLKKSLDDSLKALSQIEPFSSKCIIRLISQGSLPHLRLCRDIPRFFRRTNRAHPTRPRPYVEASLSLPLHFHSTVASSYSPPKNPSSDTSQFAWVDADLLDQWMAEIFSEITTQYFSDVTEVLTSVQKMEESLRRLKRIKGGGGVTRISGAVPNEGFESSSSTDDDDKIRAQLALDVHSFCQLVENTGMARQRIKKLPELVELVDNSMNRDYGNKPC